jgi:predicted nuclease with RNAse H fold
MKKLENQFFMGIDVQKRRDCAYMVLDNQASCISSGWLEGKSNEEICEALIRVIKNIGDNGIGNIAIGIDAPRAPLISLRKYFWRRNDWRRREREYGYGRHCEVILKALNLANPQWTPIKEKCHSWMKLGFAIFSCLANMKKIEVFEVFPTASYAILKDRTKPKVTIDFSKFFPGPKDMLDACVSAVTVQEYVHGRGCEVGGGDGLGKIILPGPLKVEDTHRVLSWPD